MHMVSFSRESSVPHTPQVAGEGDLAMFQSFPRRVFSPAGEKLKDTMEGSMVSVVMEVCIRRNDFTNCHVTLWFPPVHTTRSQASLATPERSGRES